MDVPPRDPNESILNRDMLINIAVQSLVMTAAVLISFYYGWQNYGIDMGRTYALVTLIVSELLRAYSARSEKLPIWKLGVFSNRNMNLATIVSFGCCWLSCLFLALRDIFNVEMLRFRDWDFAIIMAVLPLGIW
jgi:Ca2+-transporting ATPase